MLDWCSGEGIAAIPYGGGSSVVGGIEPRFDGPAVTIDLGATRPGAGDRHGQPRRPDPGRRLGPHLEDQLRPHGLTLRHFPQSFAFSTLGGWLATRAGGHFATLYTHIDDLTESMRVVTPSGVSESRRLPGLRRRAVAGPAVPRLRGHARGDHRGLDAPAGPTALAGHRIGRLRRLRRRGQRRPGPSPSRACFPSNCRLLDAAEAFLNAGTTVTGGLLVLGFESADHPVDPWLDRALEIARDHGGTAGAPYATGRQSEDAASSWRSSFLRMPYHRDVLARRSMIVETFETACTWDRFEALHAAVTTAAHEAVEQVCGSGVVTCRFTHVYPDGPAPYFGIYAPGRWGSTVAQWDEIKAAVSEAIDDQRRHHHPPPRGRARPPALVRPAAPRRLRHRAGRRQVGARPGRHPQPRRAAGRPNNLRVRVSERGRHGSVWVIAPLAKETP